MSNYDTRMTLLVRIRNADDRQAWTHFFELYTPLVYSYALKNGFQDADASDVAQEVMCTVAKAIGTFDYDPSKGSFRGWLLTVTRNCLRKRWEQNRRQSTTMELTSEMAQSLEDPSTETNTEWDREYALRVFHWAADSVRSEFKESTWNAFWMTTVDGKAIDATAEVLGISIGAVYIARSRVLAKIRTVVGQFDEWGS